jgi:predicted Zn-ribbon and HTH transcriptional regulator
MLLLIAILWLLVLTAITGVIVESLINRRDRALRKRGFGVHPRCGQCGYDVHCLPSNRCPECGSHLGVVGRIWEWE